MVLNYRYMSKTVDPGSAENLVELLRLRASFHPDRIAYRFLSFEPDTHDHILTYRELYRESAAVAAALKRVGSEEGDRALLLYPPGNAFFPAFFGCMMAGVTGIPLFPPRNNKSDRRIASVSRNSEAEFILTTEELRSVPRDNLPELNLPESGRWIGTDRISDHPLPENQYLSAAQDDTLYIQYTSGSTSEPKGVEITAENIMLCLEDLDRLFGHGEEGCTVSWLPHFHDMGLIYGNLLPLYWGHPAILMAPIDFIHRPDRWLQAITDFGGTSSAAPNFAFQLCLDEIPAENANSFDLGSWRAAFIASEPNRRETMEGFAERFEPAGFRHRTFAPAWGQAESTLQITAIPLEEEVTYLSVDKNEMANDRLVEVPADSSDALSLVGTGWTCERQEIKIVDSDSFRELEEMQVGEIWLKGPLVGKGYWNNPQQTEETFRAHISDSGEGPFLRTGDLGFIKDRQVYITGRLKDIIIIRGLNYYPQDIEHTVHKSHEALRIDKGAAFSVEVRGQERLVVTQELDRDYLDDYNEEEIFKAVRRAVSEVHELQVHHIVILRPKSILRTSSGKIQHSAMKSAYLEDKLSILTQSDPLAYGASVSLPPAPEPGSDGQAANLDFEALSRWLREWCTRNLGIDGSNIHPRESFLNYGMDSVSSVNLSSDLSALTGLPLSPAVAYDYPSIEKMARHLSGGESRRTLSDQSHSAAGEPIAIVGASCRFPGAEGIDRFWKLLHNGESGIREVPPQRWDGPSFYDPDLNHLDSMNTKWGGFLDHIKEFDNAFFNISYREACMMDPQQRLLMEVAYEAFEHAGIPPQQLEGSMTGVFIGVTSNEFYKRLKVHPSRGATGINNSITANRLSYHFDLRGPSLAIDTACSSSLYAVHQACQSLRANESTLAAAGGVNVILSPDLGISFSQAGMMASDGRCKSFDDQADGYVRSEGCGIVVLKKLSHAERDGDNILAVISGSALNQDGRSNGLTAPNGVSQIQVIRQALRNARIEPSEIDYLEAHGSGTPLGDVIEVRSASEVFGGTERPRQCGLGSVKANIGHLESAAGIAGLIKAALMLKHESVPPHINFDEPNRDLQLDESPFVISTPEEPADLPLQHVGISSFGFGGANAHVILSRYTQRSAEEDPAAERTGNGSGNRDAIAEETPDFPVVFSARTAEALQARLKSFQAWLRNNGNRTLGEISHTLAGGRDHFDFRLADTCRNRAGLETLLQQWIGESERPEWPENGTAGERTPKIAFLFPGQGNGYRMAGHDLYRGHPLFRETINRCDTLVGDRLPLRLTDLLYGESGGTVDLNRTLFVQPALFSLGYALCRLWTSLGVEPAAVMGHSLGELTAAAAAGVLSLEDAVEMVCTRAECMSRLSGKGAMAAVIAGEEEVRSVIDSYEELSVAAVNGPNQVVISGPLQAMNKAETEFGDRHILLLPLEVSHAFHSPMMDPAVEPFRRHISALSFHRPAIPMVSNLPGDFAGEEVAKADYWGEHILRPVRFYQGMRSLAEFGITHFLELGPGETLLNMGKKCLDPDSGNPPARPPRWDASLKSGGSSRTSLAETLTRLYSDGRDLDWKAWYDGLSTRRIPIPTYPFRRRRCWPEEHEIESPAKRTVTP